MTARALAMIAKVMGTIIAKIAQTVQLKMVQPKAVLLYMQSATNVAVLEDYPAIIAMVGVFIIAVTSLKIIAKTS
jgi:hypothetical protein